MTPACFQASSICGIRDLVLALLGAEQIAGLMFSRPMNTRVTPPAPPFR